MEAVVTSVCENIADSEESEGGMAKPKLSPEGNNKENQSGLHNLIQRSTERNREMDKKAFKTSRGALLLNISRRKSLEAKQKKAESTASSGNNSPLLTGSPKGPGQPWAKYQPSPATPPPPPPFSSGSGPS